MSEKTLSWPAVGSAPWSRARQARVWRFWRVFRRHRASVVALGALLATVVLTPLAVTVLPLDPEALSVDVLARP